MRGYSLTVMTSALHAESEGSTPSILISKNDNYLNYKKYKYTIYGRYKKRKNNTDLYLHLSGRLRLAKIPQYKQVIAFKEIDRNIRRQGKGEGKRWDLMIG